MIDGIPVWAWLIATVLGVGFGNAIGPPIIAAWTTRFKTKAETASIEVDAMVKLHPVWNETVKFLQAEIDELRSAGDAKDARIADLEQRLAATEARLADAERRLGEA